MKIAHYEKFMLEALAKADEAYRISEVPVGAVVVCGGDIIARAHNMCRTMRDPSMHAELIAMRDAVRAYGGESLSGCALVTTLEPCAMCAGAAMHFGIESIVFGAYDNQFGCCYSCVDIPNTLLQGSIKIVGGVMEKECALILDVFFRELRGRRRG